MTVVGAFAFGDFIFQPSNAAGLAVSMAGAVWYAMRSALRVSSERAGQRSAAQRSGLDDGVAHAVWFMPLPWGWRARQPLGVPPPTCGALRPPCLPHAAAWPPLPPALYPSSSLQVRQKSIKDRLLQQVPVIGRDRLKNRSMDQAQLSAAPNGFTASGGSSGQLALMGGSSGQLALMGGSSGHSRSGSRDGRDLVGSGGGGLGGGGGAGGGGGGGGQQEVLR